MSMASLIKGIKVILHQKEKTGVDAFGAPVFKTVPVVIENVLATPSAPSEIVTESQMSGKRLEYELSIPKGDKHQWENTDVEFFGVKWRTFGPVQEWIEDLVPLDWNGKVKVVRHE